MSPKSEMIELESIVELTWNDPNKMARTILTDLYVHATSVHSYITAGQWQQQLVHGCMTAYHQCII